MDNTILMTWNETNWQEGIKLKEVNTRVDIGASGHRARLEALSKASGFRDMKRAGGKVNDVKLGLVDDRLQRHCGFHRVGEQTIGFGLLSERPCSPPVKC